MELYSKKYLNFVIRDKEISLYNRTHLSDDEIYKATKYIMKKYKLSKKDALTRLVNLAIDKKLKIRIIKGKDYNSTKSVYETYVLENLEEL
jgi:AmiR/NasT family two-component response regulator